MQVVILAAGYGSRLKKETRNIPKPLVLIKKKPLIWWTLKFANLFHPSEIFVVTGYKSQQIESYIYSIRHLFKFPIKTIENPYFNKGNILSLMAAINYIHDDFLLLNADHIYDKRIGYEFPKKKGGCIVACDFNHPIVKGDTKVRVINDNIVEISKKLENFNGGYRGITLCRRSFLKTYKSRVIDTFKQIGENACVEDILGDLASDGFSLTICDISKFSWFHINTESDLYYKTTRQLANQRIGRL